MLSGRSAVESSDVSAQKDGVTTSWPSRMGQRDAFSAPQSRARARAFQGVLTGTD